VPVTTAQIADVLGVEHVQRQPWPYASSHPMERLDPAGEPPLLFKDLSRSHNLLRSAFLSDPRREITVYTSVLGRLHVDAPSYRASLIDDDRAWLFTELIDGIPLWQVAELEVWEETARCLATLHASGAATGSSLLCYDEDQLSRRYALSGSLLGGLATGALVAARLARLPQTIIHGELYASNVVIQRDAGGGVRVRPVDWETAGAGPGVLDLAALTAGSWSDAERSRIEQAYFDALPAELRPANGDLDYARLLLAAQLVGSSTSDEHAHDWAAVALGLIEELSL
jgi:Phosphotransferase enzyme family